MIDEILKTVIIGLPNFAGLLVGLWFFYNLTIKLMEQNRELQLAILEHDKSALRSEQVKAAMRGFSDERSGASQEENPVALTVANE